MADITLCVRVPTQIGASLFFFTLIIFLPSSLDCDLSAPMFLRHGPYSKEASISVYTQKMEMQHAE